jgi:hypothetical protein
LQIQKCRCKRNWIIDIIVQSEKLIFLTLREIFSTNCRSQWADDI